MRTHPTYKWNKVNLSRGLYYRYKFYKEFLKNGLNYKGDSYFADEILKEIKSGNYVDIGCYHPIKIPKHFFCTKIIGMV